MTTIVNRKLNVVRIVIDVDDPKMTFYRIGLAMAKTDTDFVKLDFSHVSSESFIRTFMDKIVKMVAEDYGKPSLLKLTSDNKSQPILVESFSSFIGRNKETVL